MTNDDQRQLDDEEWLEVLAGRASGEGPEARKAAALRQAIRSEFRTDEPPDEEARARLQARLPRRSAFRWRSGPVAAAAVLLVAVVAAVLLRPGGPPETGERLRGGGAGTVLAVEDPRATGAALRDRIQAAGGRAWLTQADGAWLLHAERPAKVPAGLAGRLRELGLAWSGDGTLEVRFRAARPDE